MRRPPSSALKDRLQQLGPNEVIINHQASCFELVCCFSSGWWVVLSETWLTSLAALLLTFIIYCSPWQGHFLCVMLCLCVANMPGKHVAPLFSAHILLHITKKPKHLVEWWNTSMLFYTIAYVHSPTPFPLCPSLTPTHRPHLFLSEPPHRCWVTL